MHSNAVEAALDLVVGYNILRWVNTYQMMTIMSVQSDSFGKSELRWIDLWSYPHMAKHLGLAGRFDLL